MAKEAEVPISDGGSRYVGRPKRAASEFAAEIRERLAHYAANGGHSLPGRQIAA